MLPPPPPTSAPTPPGTPTYLQASCFGGGPVPLGLITLRTCLGLAMLLTTRVFALRFFGNITPPIKCFAPRVTRNLKAVLRWSTVQATLMEQLPHPLASLLGHHLQKESQGSRDFQGGHSSGKQRDKGNGSHIGAGSNGLGGSNGLSGINGGSNGNGYNGNDGGPNALAYANGSKEALGANGGANGNGAAGSTLHNGNNGSSLGSGKGASGPKHVNGHSAAAAAASVVSGSGSGKDFKDLKPGQLVKDLEGIDMGGLHLANGVTSELDLDALLAVGDYERAVPVLFLTYMSLGLTASFVIPVVLQTLLML